MRFYHQPIEYILLEIGILVLAYGITWLYQEFKRKDEPH